MFSIRIKLKQFNRWSNIRMKFEKCYLKCILLNKIDDVCIVGK